MITLDNTTLSLEPPLVNQYFFCPSQATPFLPKAIQNLTWSNAVRRLMIAVGGVNDGWGIGLKGNVKEDGSIELYHVTSEGDKVMSCDVML